MCFLDICIVYIVGETGAIRGVFHLNISTDKTRNLYTN